MMTKKSTDIQDYFKRCSLAVDKKLKELLPPASAKPASLHEAMRYAVLNGGKRIRPILAIACAESVGGTLQKTLIPACSIELIHAYSLVHDDLPCMDDDDYRRGNLTVHKKYDEATAVLVGDSLLTYAFELISRVKSPKLQGIFLKTISQAAGTKGMIGGQVVDKEYESKKKTLAVMDYINKYKTGKLIEASCQIGALAGGANLNQIKDLATYGRHLGLVFQLIDDIIDGDGYVTYAGEEACLSRAKRLTHSAKKIALKMPKKQETLIDIAEFILNRRK